MTSSKYADQLAELIERLQGLEALDFEVKSARGGLPQSIWPSISAFANTAGGWLVLGVAERDGVLSIEGVPNSQELLQQLATSLRNPQRINQSPCGANDLRIEEVGGQSLVVLRVPPTPRRNKPVFINRDPYQGTYIRSHEGDHHCTRSEVERMMREAAELSADQVILDGFSNTDIDWKSVARYRQRFQTANPDSPHNALDDEAFLGVLGAKRLERETGRSGLTVAGLLMFGTDDAIRSWRGRHLIDFRHIDGDPSRPGVTHWHDRLAFEGNLLNAYDAIIGRLLRDLPVPFDIVGGVRVDDGPGQRSIREAFVNALVHADYRETDATLVVKSEQGFFFRNPGASRVPDVSASLADRSDPRNPELLRMFRYIGFAEEAGSGIPRMLQGWRRLGFDPPDFDLGENRYEFSVVLRLTHLFSAEDRFWLRSIGIELSEDEQLALIVARHEGSIDNARLRELTGLHPVDVTRVLGGLRDAGMLHMLGAKRGARYELDPGLLNLSGLNDSTADSEPSTADSAPSTADSEPSTADSAASTIVGTPRWKQLESIARPISATGYTDSALRDKIIVRLCTEMPLSLLELTWLLQRNKQYVRQILKQLVEQERLQYEFPDRPQHPNQRYLASIQNSPGGTS